MSANEAGLGVLKAGRPEGKVVGGIKDYGLVVGHRRVLIGKSGEKQHAFQPR